MQKGLNTIHTFCLQKYRNNVLNKKVKNLTAMFLKYTHPLYLLYTCPPVPLGASVCNIVCCFMSCCCCHTWLTIQEKKKKVNKLEDSRVPLLFYLYVSSQDCGYFPLHEGPGYIGADQRATLPTGTVHLAGGALLLDALPGAREAELVGRHRRALDKMSVF